MDQKTRVEQWLAEHGRFEPFNRVMVHWVNGDLMQIFEDYGVSEILITVVWEEQRKLLQVTGLADGQHPCAWRFMEDGWMADHDGKVKMMTYDAQDDLVSLMRTIRMQLSQL